MDLATHHIIPSHSQFVLQTGELIPPNKRGLHHKSWLAGQKNGADSQRAPEWPGKLADCIILAEKSLDYQGCQKQLKQLLPQLNRNGQISVLFPGELSDTITNEFMGGLLKSFSLILYHSGLLSNGANGTSLGALVMVRSDYDPVRHAREKALSGRIDEAIEILNAIPMNLIRDNDTLAELAREKQRYYLNWQKLCAGKTCAHRLFGPAHKQFAQVTALKPHCHPSYHLHAEYWSHLGRHDMAARMLRSLEFITPDAETRLLLSYYENKPVPVLPTHDDDLPVWDSPRRSPRILVLTHDYSDYGMDTLYHGLCSVLGNDNVVEFPWKPTLHNQQADAANNYPCVFNFPGDVLSVDSLVRELEQGRFDLVLHADVVQMAHQSEVRRIMRAAAGLPVVLYDSWDECFIPIERVLEYLDLGAFDLVFKRELLDGVTYDQDPLPLPFSYPRELVVPLDDGLPGEPIFWAGKKDYGLRPLYIEWLEKKLKRPLDRSLSQEEYRQALCRSRIGLSFFGCGFDTVRYWEVPANGVMLMSERLPIRIPYNFEDGVSAVFFDDLVDMESKLDYYLHHPEACDRIAAAGQAHYNHYHTTTARARQFLGAVCKGLDWK